MAVWIRQLFNYENISARAQAQMPAWHCVVGEEPWQMALGGSDPVWPSLGPEIDRKICFREIALGSGAERSLAGGKTLSWKSRNSMQLGDTHIYGFWITFFFCLLLVSVSTREMGSWAVSLALKQFSPGTHSFIRWEVFLLMISFIISPGGPFMFKTLRMLQEKDLLKE